MISIQQTNIKQMRIVREHCETSREDMPINIPGGRRKKGSDLVNPNGIVRPFRVRTQGPDPSFHVGVTTGTMFMYSSLLVRRIVGLIILVAKRGRIGKNNAEE